MIYCKIDYPCKVCGQKQKWYIMPADSKTKSGDIVPSNTVFIIQCKSCGQTYKLSFIMKIVEKRIKSNDR